MIGLSPSNALRAEQTDVCPRSVIRQGVDDGSISHVFLMYNEALSPSAIAKSPDHPTKTFLGVTKYSTTTRNLDGLFQEVEKLKGKSSEFEKLKLSHEELEKSHKEKSSEFEKLKLSHEEKSLELGKLKLSHEEKSLELGKLKLSHEELEKFHKEKSLELGELKLFHEELEKFHKEKSLELGKLKLSHETLENSHKELECFVDESNFKMWWQNVQPRDLVAAEIIIKFHDTFCTKILREVVNAHVPVLGTTGAAEFYKALKDLFLTSKISQLRFERLLIAKHSLEWDTVWSCHLALGAALQNVISSVEQAWDALHPDFSAGGWKVVDLMKNFSDIREDRNKVHMVTMGNVAAVDALLDVRAACDKEEGSFGGFKNPLLTEIGPLLKKLCEDEMTRPEKPMKRPRLDEEAVAAAEE